ncbi:hypothetical protein X896_724 [Burkholderia pseudomallei ABCPW 1]|nr:hypothetical protein X896_724 [Burkholderia pseudomallei ABCPW 1]
MSRPTVRLTTSARVTVTLEVKVGSWGPECQLSQVYRQGTESARGRIRNLIQGSGYHGIRIVEVGPIEALTTNMEVKT